VTVSGCGFCPKTRTYEDVGIPSITDRHGVDLDDRMPASLIDAINAREKTMYEA
jgi:hypothetical protein